MKKCIVNTFTDSEGVLKWRCKDPKFLVSTAHAVTQKKCTYYKCPGRADIVTVDVPECAWKNCKKPVAPNKLRHCSEVCRKRDNRYQYVLRQKQKKAQEAQLEKSKSES